MVPPTSDDLKVALAQQVQHFPLLQIELDNEVLLGLYLVETRTAVLPAFPGFLAR